jgi:nucleoside-diphosphate-sugar epimerase
MGKKIFVAGATGVIGSALVPLLRDAGHTVAGTTRTADGKNRLEALGIDAVVVDVFDGKALAEAMTACMPDVVIHQLTDLSAGIDPAKQEEALRRNARIRREGTANLVEAARAASVRRLIGQSIAWAYAAKATPWLETDPLDIHATGPRAISVCEGVVPLERAILEQNDFEGVVLRYGQLYGPRTWSTQPNGASSVHVDAAAYAALLAVDHGRPGVYNIAEPGGAVSIERARAEFGWHADFRAQPRN